MRDAVIRVLILIILVVAHHYRGIISQPVAAHQRKVVLKCSSANGIAATLEFSQRIGTGVDEIVYRPAPIMVLQTFVYRRNTNESCSVEWHVIKFSQK